MSYQDYTDKDGNVYKLVYMPYVKGQSACQGCAFAPGGSSRCRDAKSCTPTDCNGRRLLGSGYAWAQTTQP